MSKLILLVVAGYLLYRALGRWAAGVGGGAARRDLEPIDDDLVQDPVCGVYVAARQGVRLRRRGGEIVFCSEACRDRYLDSETGEAS
jgi:YHS domain-containing protein